MGSGGSPHFEEVIYAPSDRQDWEKRTGNCVSQVCVQSNLSFFGSIVASSVDIHAAASDFEYDEGLQGEDIEVYPEGHELPPQITYLNIAEYEIGVENQ